MTPWSAAIVNAMLVCLLLGSVSYAMARFLERWCHTAHEQRMLWRMVVALNLLLVMLEVSGLNQWRLHSSTEIVTRHQLTHTPAVSLPIKLPLSLPIMQFSGSAPSFPFNWVWLGSLWLAGSSLLFLRLLLIQALLFRWQSQLCPIRDTSLQQQVNLLVKEMGLRPHVGQRSHVETPFVFGVWKPTLVLPVRFPAALTWEQREAVLRHELTHLAVHDPRWHLLADVLCLVLWWNPAAWLIKRHWKEATELAADEAVVQSTANALPLAESLLVWQTATQLKWGLSIVSRPPSLLGKRIRRILEPKLSLRQSYWHRHGVRTSLLALAMMMVMIGVGYARFSIDKENEPMKEMNVFRRSLLGLALLAATETSLPAQGAVQEPAGARRSAVAAGKSEEGAILAMGLGAEETAKFRQVLIEREKQTEAFHALPSGEQTKAGKAIGESYRASLQLIFTPEQYSRYLEYWEFNKVVIKMGGKKQGDYTVMVTAHPFDAEAAMIIKNQKLTKEQQTKLLQLSEGLKKSLSKMNELVTSPKNLGEVDSLIARTQRQRNEELKAILGAEGYAKYREHLNELITTSWNRTTAARASAGGGGFAAPIK